MFGIHKGVSTSKKLVVIGIFVFLFLVSLVILLFKKEADNPYTYQMQSSQQEKEVVFGKLILAANPISKDMASGTLCLDGISKVKKVDLFMPDMGHGSAPPMVSVMDTPKSFFIEKQGKKDFGCLKIERMELFMPGLWQVRVFSDVGQMGYFDLNLAE